MGQEELAKYYQQPSGDCPDNAQLPQQFSWPVLETSTVNSNCSADEESLTAMQLLVQAHMLLRKNVLYQRIDRALRKQMFFQTTVYDVISSIDENAGTAKETVTPALRDTAVSNIRFLCIFYDCHPNTFAVATNLLDRLLGQVKVHSKYLATIATCCFYIAVRLQQANPESNGNGGLPLIKREELLKLSQCGEHTTLSDLIFTECQILDLVPCELGVTVTTSLDFLQLFYEMCALTDTHLLHEELCAAAIAKLEVVMCRFDFTRFRPDVLALALLDCVLPDLTQTSHFSTIVELQYYCQMYDGTYPECVALIKDYLKQYDSQPNKLPHLKLTWSISRRVLHKMKPSTRVQLDLEPILEDDFFSNCEMSGSDCSGDFLELPQSDDMSFISSCHSTIINTEEQESLTGLTEDNKYDDPEEAFDDPSNAIKQPESFGDQLSPGSSNYTLGIDSVNENDLFSYSVDIDGSKLAFCPLERMLDGMTLDDTGGKHLAAAASCAQCYQSASRYMIGGYPGTSQMMLCHCDSNNNQVAA